ncbi:MULTISPECIES: FtsH protease activity modulator HflK [unclassified Fusibacter]|uniref:FtsH protease activity modulator HflK n=1 Tax=unclassified Fusibacter TaxID=2624464 RepID=UPI0010115F6F|nr:MULTISPECIES: FtsH protease activity modulator HflK [unclassified Fusibacter]MCK8058743.1 FtsH protease activity modulator HflK [Fusibacter sp. A2]NPE21817.1 FtsH protease activity modulator HflK [Fusibacter sp. A1]RXV61389.1 FtsH protease activity modulator HflK [Fusibacter sp. A1]
MKGLANFIIVLVIVGVIAANGIYKLEDGEQAVITRFGEFLKNETQSGLKWKIPVVDQKYVIRVSELRRMEFGYVTTDSGGTNRYAEYQDITSDSLMITGDENLVNVTASIQYKISNAKDYLFNVDDQLGTLNIIAVSTIRRSVANNSLDDVLADNKFAIMQEIRTDLQQICDDYKLGVQITDVLLQDVDPPAEVDDAFKDIVRAQLDKESKINEAISYENQIIPEAKGLASKLISDAEAYKAERISEAKGDVASFNAVYEKYVDAKEVTRTRLYLETMAEILKNVEIFVTKEDGNTLKFLPLQGGTN